MVAFSYTKSSSKSLLDRVVEDITGKAANSNLDPVNNSSIGLQLAQAQIQVEQSKNSISESDYTSASQRLLASAEQLRQREEQDKEAYFNTKTAAANNSAGEQVAQSQTADPLTAEERQRFERGESITRTGEEAPVALSVSGSNQPNTDDQEDNEDERQTVSSATRGSGARPNPLARYTTYSYGLSLHYMTLEQYNSVVVLGQEYSPSGRVMIASGGRQTSDFVRDSEFKDSDMFLDGLKIVTVIGHNAKTRASNVVTIEFTVKEPLGMSFLEKLVTVAKKAGIRSWDQMPLVLQIDFFAINEDGTYEQTPIPGVSKFICIKITEIGIGISTTGGEYRVVAIPVGHSALLQTSSTVPANFEITAKTVADFFDNTVDTQSTEKNYENTGTTAQNNTRDSTAAAQPKPKTYQNLSFASALNQYQQKLVEKGYQEVADEYVFKINSNIANNDIFIPELHNIAMSAAQNDKTKSPTLDRSRGVIPINAGTNIKEVINLVLRASDFYRNKIKPPDEVFAEGQQFTSSQLQTILEGKPIDLHKTTVRVEFVPQWDSIRKQYKRRFIYDIRNYRFHNNKYPEARRSLPGPNEIQKEYNYMFMGKNQEIRDFKIEFNALFFQALTAFETKTSQDNLQTKEKLEKTRLQGGSDGVLAPLRYVHVINQTQTQSQLSDGSKENVEAVDLFNSILSNARGDMIDLTLQIAGDPDLIKQDEMFFPPSDQSTVNGSIAMDTSEVFCSVVFKVPIDINQDTGLYKFESKNSSFSGIYKIVEVENIFENGNFYQNLRGYRLFDQRVDVESQSQSRRNNDTRPVSGWESPANTANSTNSQPENQTLAETQRLLRQNAERIDQTSSVAQTRVGRAGQTVISASQNYESTSSPQALINKFFSGRTGRAGQGSQLRNLPQSDAGQTNDYPSP